MAKWGIPEKSIYVAQRRWPQVRRTLQSKIKAKTYLIFVAGTTSGVRILWGVSAETDIFYFCFCTCGAIFRYFKRNENYQVWFNVSTDWVLCPVTCQQLLLCCRHQMLIVFWVNSDSIVYTGQPGKGYLLQLPPLTVACPPRRAYITICLSYSTVADAPSASCLKSHGCRLSQITNIVKNPKIWFETGHRNSVNILK